MKVLAIASNSSSAEPLYTPRAGLWCQSEGDVLWLMHASGFFCGLRSSGQVNWQLKSNAKAIELMPLIGRPSKLRVGLGALTVGIEPQTRWWRTAPGRLRPDQIYFSQNRASYGLSGLGRLEAEGVLSGSAGCVVYAESRLRMLAVKRPALVPEFEPGAAAAAAGWQLQQLLTQPRPNIGRLLTVFYTHRQAFSVETKKAVYLALAAQFRRDLEAARRARLKAEPPAFKAAARAWAQLGWWRSNQLALHLVLEGLELFTGEEAVADFRLVHNFTAAANADTAWTYDATWFRPFGRGSLTALAATVERAVLEQKTARLAAERL